MQKNKKQKLIVIDDAVPYANEIFSHLGKVVTAPGREIDNSLLLEADALIVRSRTQVNAALLDNTSVKFVGSTVVGLDHVDQEYLKKQNIHFYSAQGCNANSVAEFVITALFQAAEAFGFELTSKTLGIIGVGNVGSRLYDKATKLGIKCVLNDPPKLEANPSLAQNHHYTDLNTCLKADIISVHTPLTKIGKHATLDLISATKLAKIIPDQIIINAARGGIINEAAWIKTQTKLNIIDCWENEPFIDEALYNTAWIATPHIAGHSLDAKVAGSSMVYDALCQFWQTTPLTDWQKALPAQPNTIEITQLENTQTQINQLLTLTHNPQDDDLAIRAKNIKEVHKKYEHYRRNFPIYREWHNHRLNLLVDSPLKNLMKSINFKVFE